MTSTFLIYRGLYHETHLLSLSNISESIKSFLNEMFLTSPLLDVIFIFWMVIIIYFLQKPPINFIDFLWDVKDSKTGLELIIQKVANVP